LFLDLIKAFDCLDYNLLLLKINQLMLPSSYYAVFENYFQDRSQSVTVNDCCSGILDVSLGIFQGSILGPLMFILYIDGIFKLNLNGIAQAYADEIAIVYSEESPTVLRSSILSDLEQLYLFLGAHVLALNVSKTKYIS
jgi:hypothetical protein